MNYSNSQRAGVILCLTAGLFGAYEKNNKRNNRNNFIQYPDSKGKKNVLTNEEKPEDNIPEKKSRFGRIIENPVVAAIIGGIVGGVVAGIILNPINRYILSPSYIDISASQNGVIGHINIDRHDEEGIVYFMDSDYNLEINLDNNSDIFMQITDICVNVIRCTDITEEDITIGDYIIGGDAKRAICLKTKIEHHTGKMETEIDKELNPEYNITPDSYIAIANNTGEKFILSTDFEKQGYYNIEVKFSYRYDGKTQTVKTDPFNCIFLERYMEDS